MSEHFFSQRRKQLVKQGFARREIVVESPLRNAGAARDGRDSRPCITMLTYHFRRGLDDGQHPKFALLLSGESGARSWLVLRFEVSEPLLGGHGRSPRVKQSFLQ